VDQKNADWHYYDEKGGHNQEDQRLRIRDEDHYVLPVLTL